MEAKNLNEKKVLNPFALPPETDARFNLLIAAILVLSIILSSYLPFYIYSEFDVKINVGKTKPQTETTFQEGLQETADESIQKVKQYLFPLLIFVIVMILLIFFTIYIYKRHPIQIIKKQKLKSLHDATDIRFQKIKDEIRSLSDLYGIKIPETFISSNFTAGSQAFGYTKRSMLRVDNGLRILVSKNVQKFRSIILHEMGHFVNNDVSRMYVARSLWRTALFLFAIPTIILIIITFLSGIWSKISDGISTDDLLKIFFTNIPVTLTLLFAIAGSFGIIYMILKSLVRVREYYADWRAASVGAKEGLTELFNERMKYEKDTPFYKFLGWHPTWNDRLRIIKNPSELFILRKDIPFFVGILIPISLNSFFTFAQIGYTLVGLFSGLSLLVTQNYLLNLISTLLSFIMMGVFCFTPFAISTYLISSSLGLQVQRNIVSSLALSSAKDFNFMDLIITSLLMTLGIIAGSMLIPYFSILTKLVDINLVDFATDKLPLLILTFMIAFIANLLWLFYIKFFTPLVYRRYIKNKLPTLPYLIFTISSSLLLAILYLPGATFFFQIYSQKIEVVNSLIKILLILTPVLYLFYFAITGIVLWIYNRTITKCPFCNERLEEGNLLGRTCVNCHALLGEWIFIKTNAGVQ